MFKFYSFVPRFPVLSLLFSSISLPKLQKIQTLAKIYQFLIELPGCMVFQEELQGVFFQVLTFSRQLSVNLSE